MKREVYVFNDKQELADQLASDFERTVGKSRNGRKRISVALSGGNTPRIFFERLASTPYRDRVPWSNVNLFWGDERCVPPDDEQSNFKMANDTFISKVNIPDENVHRIIGENLPEVEAQRYGEEILKDLPSINGLPEFDWIFLGMGTDGHTASLFPNAPTMEEIDSICIVAEHPQTGQKRISLTLPVINNARRVSFLVAGKDKAKVLKEILGKGDSPLRYPASKVNPENGVLEWYIDKEAAPEN